MIEGIGYTDDGLVWLRLVMEIDKQPHTGTMLLTPETAKRIGEKLTEASDIAEKSNVRNSANTH